MRKRGWMLGMALLGLGVLAQGGDEGLAKRIWSLLAGFSGEDYRYTWHYVPGKPMGFYQGTEPHGAILRTFVNNIAQDAIQARVGRYPVGAILVKDNHMPDGRLDAITVMVKMPEGYDPEHNDWFWAKYTPTGQVDLAGKVPMCAQCHAQVRAQDYVFSAPIR